MPPSFNATNKTGFTLVEVLLALGLTALLLGLLSTGVYVVAEDWNRNSDVLDNELDESLALLQLDRAFQGAFPHSFTNLDNLSREIFFQGDDDTLRFVSTVSPQRTSGLTAWAITSEPDAGVYVTLSPAYTDHPGERLDAQTPRLILPGYTVEFAYLYEDSNEDHVWRDDWLGDEALSLPLAIYARFEAFDDDDDVIEILTRIRTNLHRDISPNTFVQQGL